ncbi:MAG: thioredoxin family protein [Proteiniphilum sp.]|jgi:hypothetical protein|nr:thioredoxin family protein [Proteiniphilum sp.]
MDSKRPFSFRPWHFLTAILLFVTLTGIIAEKNTGNIPPPDENASTLTELHAEDDPARDGITMLFFYRRDSDACAAMRRNIERMDAATLRGIRLYAAEVEENSEYFYRYNISGVPCLLILDGYIEAKRVMGLVSTDNLRRIADRMKSKPSL